MKRLLFLSFLLTTACLDFLKTEPEEEDEEDEDPEEGDQIGDCYDGEDNDEDGDIDCDDSGCSTKPACLDTGFDTDTEDTDVEGSPTLMEHDVAWGSSSVLLSMYIENSPSDDYYWGIAETHEDCAQEGWCWTGEDCFMGYTLEDGTLLSYCHPISEYGGELYYGGDPMNLSEGDTTVFPNDYASLTTHLIDHASSNGPCWVFGADTSYYNSYSKSCTEM